jgi:hypothetical protein
MLRIAVALERIADNTTEEPLPRIDFSARRRHPANGRPAMLSERVTRTQFEETDDDD